MDKFSKAPTFSKEEPKIILFVLEIQALISVI